MNDPTALKQADAIDCSPFRGNDEYKKANASSA
jgi:hypothetical protein